MPETIRDHMPDSSSHKPTASKHILVQDLTLGAEVLDLFLLASAQQGQAKNGPFWRLEFRDNSGSIQGKIWSPQSQAYPELTPGCLVEVAARVVSYRDKLELQIERLRILSDEETAGQDLSLFIPASSYHPDDMLAELNELCRTTLTHKPWKKLAQAILADEEIAAGLRTAPAAKSMHHAYAGGLLEHTLSVAKLCMLLADQYPQLDRQALLLGALCHDLGKIWELSYGMATEYTTPGLLIGHISIIMERLSPLIKKSGLEEPLAEHLQHLILSHHGFLEYGSPKLPSTAEAMILHYADNIDAKMQQFSAVLSQVPDGETGWSAYVPALERSLYKAVRTPEAPRPEGTSAARKKAAKEGRSAKGDDAGQYLHLPGVE